MGDDEFEVIDLHTGAVHGEGPRRQARRHQNILRRLLGSLLVGCLVIASLALVLTDATARFPDHLERSDVPPGADIIYLENTLPWGVLHIDARHIEAGLLEAQWVGTRLSVGRHALTYEAPPYPRLRCTLTVPAAPSDTCPFDHHPTAIDSGHFVGGERVIDLGATPDRLPPAHQADLLAAVTRALAAQGPVTTQLASGDHFLGADERVMMADQPLIATLTFTLNRDPARALRNSGLAAPCLDLCRPVLPQGGNARPTVWTLLVHVLGSWTYSTTEERAVLREAPVGVAPLTADALALVEVRWVGHWEVTAPERPESALCTQLPALLGQLNRAISPDLVETYRHDPTGVGGCLAVVQTAELGAGDSSGVAALFLLHTGALIAGNAQARKLLPNIPLATRAEGALVHEIAKEVGLEFTLLGSAAQGHLQRQPRATAPQDTR